MTTRRCTIYSDIYNNQTNTSFSPILTENSSNSSFTKRRKGNRSHQNTVDDDTEVDEKSFETSVSTHSDSESLASPQQHKTVFEEKFPDVAINEVDFESQITMDDEAFDRFRAFINKAVCRCNDFLFAKNGKEHYMFLFILLSSIAACKWGLNTVKLDEILDSESCGIPEELLSAPKIVPIEEGRTILICHEETRKGVTSDQPNADSLIKIYDAVVNIKETIGCNDDEIYQLFNRLCYFNVSNLLSGCTENSPALGAYASAGQCIFVRTSHKRSSGLDQKLSVEKTRIYNLFAAHTCSAEGATDATLDDGGFMSNMHMNLNVLQYHPVDSKIVIEHLFSMVFAKSFSNPGPIVNSSTVTTTTNMRISGACMKAMVQSYDRHCNDLEIFRDQKIIAMRVSFLLSYIYT